METIKMILIKNSRRVFDIREYVGSFLRLWKNNAISYFTNAVIKYQDQGNF